MPPKVLLAQKDSPDRAEANAVLNAFGCEVTVTSNGREAKNCASQTAFDFVVLDVDLEEVKGFDVARAIRQSETSKTAFIVATGNSQLDEEQRWHEVGVDEVINLNCDPDEMTNTVHKWMAKLVFRMYKAGGASAATLNLSVQS